MPRSPRPVMVTWLDAARGDSLDEAPQRTFGIVRRTLGWLVRDQKGGVLLCMSRDHDGTFDKWFSIPRAYIMTIKDLEEVTDADSGDRSGRVPGTAGLLSGGHADSASADQA